MKVVINILIFGVFVFQNGFAQDGYPCPTNGNAESNNFSNWGTCVSSSQDPQNLSLFTPGFDAGRFAVHDATSNYAVVPTPMLVNGVDYYGGFSVPSEGNYCFSIGNNVGKTQAEAMRYTFTVTNQNKIFKMRYALVLEDGGGNHDNNQNPAAWFYFVKGNGIEPSFTSTSVFSSTIRAFVGDITNPYFKISNVNSNVVYTGWQCLEFDLSGYVGQTVSFVAMVRDCVFNNGHFGYMYVDGLCTNWPATASGTLNGTTFCLNEQILLDGSSSEDEVNYFLEVAEMDPLDMNSLANNGMVVSDWFAGQQAPSNIDVSAFLAARNITLECGKKYKVKLAVSNGCFKWSEKSFRFDVYCPPVDAGSDILSCCSGQIAVPSFQIGSAPINQNTYYWYSVPNGFLSDESKVTVDSPNQSTAYIVEMTDQNGCIGKDTVLFHIVPDGYQVTLHAEYKLCDYQSYVTAQIAYIGCVSDPNFTSQFGASSLSQIRWYFKPSGSANYSLIQSGGETIHAPNANGILKFVIVNDYCSIIYIEKTINLEYRPGGHELIAPNTFTPDGGQFNTVFRILEYGPSAPLNIGDEPAYGISDFKLHLFSRSNEFRVISKADVGRLPNENVRQGDISWDGLMANGNPAQVGVYNYYLEVQYCGKNEFTRVCLPGGIENECLHSILWWCNLQFPGCSNHITLLR